MTTAFEEMPSARSSSPLAVRHRLSDRQVKDLNSIPGANDKPLDPSAPIGSQISFRALDDPVRVQGEARIAREFVKRVTCAELAKRHKVTEAAVQRRLVRAGVFDNETGDHDDR
jgi:hypothetical protein